MKLAFVIQRYGREIPGGAETLARQIAERQARRHQIDVLTTTARDYAKQVGLRVPLTAAAAFSEITEAYLAERFGEIREAGDSGEALVALRRELPRRLGARAS